MSASSADHATPWCTENLDGSITLRFHVQPAAKLTGFAGIQGGSARIRLTAPPADGKANAMLLAFLAAAFGVPRRSVTLVRGDAGRSKTVHIAAPALRPDREWK